MTEVIDTSIKSQGDQAIVLSSEGLKALARFQEAFEASCDLEKSHPEDAARALENMKDAAVQLATHVRAACDHVGHTV
ncbi:hypothetical protein [Pseudomonas gingeri]|uniref:hypothetical protein n=1 Tax=Pseudomonas gingeri TaxID=117681 RepID=UPI00159FF58B|nr:hypothetical protein [Pseudomonas gingeri]NWD05065.1 hypothetical protein [Pseudomonas gingeri]NWE31389.1 hypothetical protein [Pseudomonas gingeri]NWE44413.1 hypothetical protein [Pseudomonas gingeri]NWE56841.1 hypothetical protein [Pseudomonas gingeri]NWF05323.1 hypothetical protein [Pseudomonas gingeri]